MADDFPLDGRRKGKVLFRKILSRKKKKRAYKSMNRDLGYPAIIFVSLLFTWRLRGPATLTVHSILFFVFVLRFLFLFVASTFLAFLGFCASRPLDKIHNNHFPPPMARPPHPWHASCLITQEGLTFPRTISVCVCSTLLQCIHEGRLYC